MIGAEQPAGRKPAEQLPRTAAEPSGNHARLECRPMHPFARNLVIGGVGLIIAGGLTALAVLGRDSGTSVMAMLAAGAIAAAVGIFLFVQGWIWSQRAYRQGSTGRSIVIALGGGLMIVLAAVALAGTVILVLVFFLS
jgi:hypothetical protein